MEAWKLFCQRLSIPPFAVWEGLPGFERLQRALQLAEKCAFTADEWLAWLNSVWPEEAQRRRRQLRCGLGAGWRSFRRRVGVVGRAGLPLHRAVGCQRGLLLPLRRRTAKI